jgi:hypothetical protein
MTDFNSAVFRKGRAQIIALYLQRLNQNFSRSQADDSPFPKRSAQTGKLRKYHDSGWKAQEISRFRLESSGNGSSIPGLKIMEFSRLLAAVFHRKGQAFARKILEKSEDYLARNINACMKSPEYIV